ncbi:MAG: hypothetical protein AB1467_06775 [Candidatus Diapherotrites archaeon]
MGYRDYIKTIEDLERLYYSPMGAKYIQKVDAPVITSTTGVYNAVYGKMVWTQVNQEANAFGVLSKFVWDKDGWRAVTARAASTGGGVAENAALPDTIKPTFAELSTKPKTIAHNFDVSEVQEFEAAISDNDAFGAMDEMRALMGVHHKEMMNVMLFTDNDTLAGNNLESLDRIMGSYSEIAGCLQTAGDLDIYGQDRDAAASWTDAYVNHNSNTDRDLTDTILRTAFQNIRTNGGNTTVILTKEDTYASIQGLYETQVRYNPIGEATAKIGVNGIQTKEGIGIGIDVATLYGVPLIVSKDCTADTIGRIFFLDTSDPEGYGKPRLGLKIAKPTQYFEAGMNAGDPFGINRLGTEGMYRTMGELLCHRFAGQGKIRDLK